MLYLRIFKKTWQKALIFYYICTYKVSVIINNIYYNVYKLKYTCINYVY